MTQRLMSNTSSDVYESVRAVLVDKEDLMDNAPAWRPPALCDGTERWWSLIALFCRMVMNCALMEALK
jgi:hypothetical protein